MDAHQPVGHWPAALIPVVNPDTPLEIVSLLGRRTNGELLLTPAAWTKTCVGPPTTAKPFRAENGTAPGGEDIVSWAVRVPNDRWGIPAGAVAPMSACAVITRQTPSRSRASRSSASTASSLCASA